MKISDKSIRLAGHSRAVHPNVSAVPTSIGKLFFRKKCGVLEFGEYLTIFFVFQSIRFSECGLRSVVAVQVMNSKENPHK